MKITFKSTKEEEVELFHDIKKASTFIGQSSWMKIAAHEKLEKDKIISSNNQNTNTTLIDSLDDLLP